MQERKTPQSEPMVSQDQSSAPEVKDQPSSHWQTRPFLQTCRAIVPCWSLGELKEWIEGVINLSAKENSFCHTFFDVRFSREGEYYPPACQIKKYISSNDNSHPFKINFLNFEGFEKALVLEKKEEATATQEEISAARRMRSCESFMFQDKVKSLLTQHKVAYAYGYDFQFSFKSEEEFFNALKILAREGILPPLSSSISDFSKQYQEALHATLIELESKGEEAFSVYNRTYADFRFSRYLLDIEGHKNTIRRSFVNDEKEALENVLKLTDAPFLALTIDECRSFKWEIEASKAGELFKSFQRIFCPVMSKYNYPSGFEEILERKDSGDVRADMMLTKALPKINYEQFIDFFRCAKEGRISYKTIMRLLILNGSRIAMLIDSKEKLEAVQLAIEGCYSQREQLLNWFVQFSRTRFQTQAAALAQSRLPLQLVKHIMLFAGNDTGATLQNLGEVVDAVGARVDGCAKRKPL